MKKEGIRRGFAFITYQTPIQARNAITALNGSALGEKRLFVSLAYQNEMINSCRPVYRNSWFPGFNTRMVLTASSINVLIFLILLLHSQNMIV